MALLGLRWSTKFQRYLHCNEETLSCRYRYQDVGFLIGWATSPRSTTWSHFLDFAGRCLQFPNFLRRLLQVFFCFVNSPSVFLPKSLKLDTVKVFVENAGFFQLEVSLGSGSMLYGHFFRTSGCLWYNRISGRLPNETSPTNKLKSIWAMKKGPPWLFRVYRGWNTTQVIIINHEIRIPIKQPVFHGKYPAVFFLWLIFPYTKRRG